MTTPTPEAIKAAEAALDLHGEYSTNDQLAVIALTAATPFIAAQAKAEALREAADALNTEAIGFQNGWSSSPTDVGKLDGIAQTRDWLRARAATFEGADS